MTGLPPWKCAIGSARHWPSAASLACAAYPALTRLYDPSQFGVLGAFEAVLAMALSFCTLRYHLAIAVPDDDADAAALVVASVVVSGTISVLVALLLLLPDAHGLRL